MKCRLVLDMFDKPFTDEFKTNHNASPASPIVVCYVIGEGYEKETTNTFHAENSKLLHKAIFVPPFRQLAMGMLFSPHHSHLPSFFSPLSLYPSSYSLIFLLFLFLVSYLHSEC
jgi:hypothetical protein